MSGDLDYPTRAHIAEDIIGIMAPFAESASVDYEGQPQDIVSAALDRHSLLDDYLRILRGEQGMAFDESATFGASLKPEVWDSDPTAIRENR